MIMLILNGFTEHPLKRPCVEPKYIELADTAVNGPLAFPADGPNQKVTGERFQTPILLSRSPGGKIKNSFNRTLPRYACFAIPKSALNKDILPISTIMIGMSTVMMILAEVFGRGSGGYLRNGA